MVKYIPDIYLGAINGNYRISRYIEMSAGRNQFIYQNVRPEVNRVMSKFRELLESELKRIGLYTLVKVYPKFSYYTMWGNAWDPENPEDRAFHHGEMDPDDPTSDGNPGSMLYQLHTGLKLSLVIAFSDLIVGDPRDGDPDVQTVPELVAIAIYNSLVNAFAEEDEKKEFQFLYCSVNPSAIINKLVKAIFAWEEFGYLLYHSRPSASEYGPVPVVQARYDSRNCTRVLAPPGMTFTECVSYSEKYGDEVYWVGIGACIDPFIFNGDGTTEPNNEEFMLAENLIHQRPILDEGPYNSSLSNFTKASNVLHGPKLQNLVNRLRMSISFDNTVPGVVALNLVNGFAGADDMHTFAYSDSESAIKIISGEDLDNLNYVVFSLQSELKNNRIKLYYFLQRPLSLSDLEKLLIASAGNVLVICGDYGDKEYRSFLNSNGVKLLLIRFRYMVQYVFIHEYIDINDSNCDQINADYKAGNILPLQYLFESMVIPEKEITWIDFSKIDIKFNEANEDFLRNVLMDHSGKKELVNNFINRYDKKAENYTQIIKDFRTFRSERFEAELQNNLNSLRRELGDLKNGSDQEEHDRLIGEINNLTAALKGASLVESKYTAAKDWDAELENLRGLTKAKAHIRDLKKIIAARYSRGADDVTTKNVFTFEGNPGCGKTMVARYFAYSLKQNGLLSADEPFCDINISELVGTYVGQAADKTDKIFERCAGSVIFIDEAYGLLDQNEYGRSAINSIVKNISSMSPDTVLILAGYPQDISHLLKENRGLESRVAKRIVFDDYSCRELLDILRDNLGRNCGLYYDLENVSEIEETVKEFLLKASSCSEHNTGRTLGNARFIDNLISKLEIAHAATLTDEDLKVRIDTSQFPIDMSEGNTKEDAPEEPDGQEPQLTNAELLQGIKLLNESIGADGPVAVNGYTDDPELAEALAEQEAFEAAQDEEPEEETEEQKRSKLVSKLRTVTLDIVKSAIADLNTELDKTGSAIGSTRSSYYVPTTEKDTFERVIGNSNAKRLLRQQLDIFQHPEKYRYAPDGTRGILLTGDPGCGKTMLARAMAHEAGNDVAFLSANSTDFIKEYLGEGAKAVGELFDEIETYDKCILFIDEIDAIGAVRGRGSSGENQVLMKLLTCLDGFKKRKNFLVIAATNAPNSLDPALRRRLGIQVAVELPSANERLQLLKLYLKERNSEGSIDDDKLKFLADYATSGFSGDRITKCVNEAYYRSAANEEPIQLKTLEDVIYGMSYGFNGNTEVNEAESRNTAYHEAGHAMVRHSFGETIFKVTILPDDDGALGYVLSSAQEAGSHTWTKAKLEHQICVSLGGRAAEELFSEDHTASNGCSSDLQKATEYAKRMVAEWGMGSTLLVRELDDKDVLREADEIIRQCYERTKEILSSNADTVRAFAELLIEKKELLKEDLDAILGKLTMNV